MTERTRNNFPYEIRDLDPEINAQISKNFSDGLPRLVQVGPQKMLIPAQFRQDAENYYNFPLRASDVFVVGYPRSGTTLTQDLVWLLLNSLDFDKAKLKSFIARVPLLESRSVTTERTIALVSTSSERAASLKSYTSTLETLSRMTERRIVKSHLHFTFLPPDLLTAGCKVIYIARNPKDVVVSLYHLQRNSFGRPFTGPFETYFDYFISNLTFFTPYWDHLHEAWKRRNEANFRFFFYEEVTQNLRDFITEVARFLDKELTGEEVQKLESTLSFDQYKKYISETDKHMNSKEDVNDDFVRKGKIGDYKNYFTKEMNERADRWIEENLKRTGIVFPFDF